MHVLRKKRTLQYLRITVVPRVQLALSSEDRAKCATLVSAGEDTGMTRASVLLS